jgi:hypothetical protein
MSCAWRTCPEDRTQMSVLCMENLHRGQDITECLVHGELDIRTGHKRMSCGIHLYPVLRTSAQCTRQSSMSCLRTSSPCTRHSFMSCPKDKFSMHKTFIYVLSSVQVLHAQDIRLCPVLMSSSPCTRHSVMSCPRCKFSMHKTLICVLSSGQVLQTCP